MKGVFRVKEQKKISLESLVSEIEKNGRIGRLGKVFKTEKNYYFYDTGTGKVAKLNSNVYIVLKSLLEGMPVEDIKNLQLSKSEFEDAISEIKSAMENEHILQAPPLKTLTGDAVTELDDILENKVENVTLEVTEKCNLRCKYCIYHPSHPEYRAFGHENMKWDVAKKAIDFLKEHSQNAENRHIGFYGGEPLLNFELIERAVEYAKKLFGEDMSFAITTNATLVNDKIAEYFAKNNFNIIISLDGPQEMHDANRLMVNGTGSFEKTVMGAKKLFEAFHKEGKSSKIGFNMVVSGPGYLEQYTKIQEFIEKSEWIPKDVMILTATVDHGPSESDYFLPQGKEDRWFMEEFYEPLMKWEEVYKSNPDNTEKTLFTDGYMDKGMMIIHKRLLTETPIQQYGMNGCCVPGQRRIYVTTKGEFLHCEKVGNIPCLGNVNEGFDKEKIKKLYVEDFIEEAKEYCKECWAVNLCTLCYVNCYDANGLHLSYRHNSCRNERKYLEDKVMNHQFNWWFDYAPIRGLCLQRLKGGCLKHLYRLASKRGYLLVSSLFDSSFCC